MAEAKTKVKKEKTAVAPKAAVVVKEVKTEKVAKTAPKASKETLNLTVSSVTITGEAAGSVKLPEDVYGAPLNRALLAQAVRVYGNNQKGHFGHTKTRGEVEGSTRKIYAQKGTGRARHGAVRAPIFVGGGIAMGPKSHKVVMSLSQKMKRAALASALSARAKSGDLMVVSDMEKFTGKTKEIVNLLSKLDKKSVLFVTEVMNENAVRAIRNIKRVRILPADQINAYEVLKYQTILMSEKATQAIERNVKKKVQE